MHGHVYKPPWGDNIIKLQSGNEKLHVFGQDQTEFRVQNGDIFPDKCVFKALALRVYLL